MAWIEGDWLRHAARPRSRSVTSLAQDAGSSPRARGEHCGFREDDLKDVAGVRVPRVSSASPTGVLTPDQMPTDLSSAAPASRYSHRADTNHALDRTTSIHHGLSRGGVVQS